jgi:hypothetical protein
MIMRWISDVPSKMVKILELRAVYAGHRPAHPRGISTDSARPVRDECRVLESPCPFPNVVRTRQELPPPGQPPYSTAGPSKVFSSLTCMYPAAGPVTRPVRTAARTGLTGPQRGDTDKPGPTWRNSLRMPDVRRCLSWPPSLAALIVAILAFIAAAFSAWYARDVARTERDRRLEERAPKSSRVCARYPIPGRPGDLS